MYTVSEIIKLTLLLTPFLGMLGTVIGCLLLPDPEFDEWDKDKHK